MILLPSYGMHGLSRPWPWGYQDQKAERKSENVSRQQMSPETIMLAYEGLGDTDFSQEMRSLARLLCWTQVCTTSNEHQPSRTEKIVECKLEPNDFCV